MWSLAAKHLSKQPPGPARALLVSLHSFLRYMGGIYPAAMRGGAETKYFYSTKRRPKPDRRHPAAAAGRQPAAARALLSRHLGPVVLHRRNDGEREIQGAAPGRRLGAVALHVAPLWCCWLASSGSGKQAARMQWFQAAPAHWRGSELLLYVSLAHGQQHRH